ncbi:MAG: cell surface protein SprA, partial [Bacteroidota bacterium]
RDLRDLGQDFSADELAGVSFIDDFEGFANTLSLKSPSLWRLASAPLSTPRVDKEVRGREADSLRSNHRATLGWYQLNPSIIQRLGGNRNDPVTGLVATDSIFANRELGTSLADRTIQTLDVYFDPQERGPYNYTTALSDFVSNPEDNFGAMIQRIPEGYTDFTQRNIEFIEFIFQPYSDAGDAGDDAELVFDLGIISGDIIPNGRLNSEDGLSTTSANPRDFDTWGRIPSGNRNNAVDINTETSWTEDLGLDGLVSYNTEAYPEELSEGFHFRRFLNTVRAQADDERLRSEVAKAELDPSGDDYRYFEDPFYDDPLYFPGGATIQQRFSRYFAGTELNALETQRLAEDASRRGNSRLPDSEDLYNTGTLNSENSYYEYRIPLSRQRLDELAAAERQPGDYVIERVGAHKNWYLVRIPVSQYTDRVGDIQDFNLIRAIRMWTTGHYSPMTMRFAKFDLVGSQWEKSQNVVEEPEYETHLSDETQFYVESINDEENDETYVSPPGTIVNQTRDVSGVPRRQREQSMLLRLERLQPGAQRAVFKPYKQGLDLLKYSNVRMYVHMHGTTSSGPIMDRDRLKIFVRIGSNESADYYEYEQPLTPSPPGVRSADALWQTNQLVNGVPVDLNSVNIALSALNQLKVIRDKENAPTTDIFWSDGIDLSPQISDFAPPGTRLAIRGNPSLARVNSIVIGVRSSDGPGMEMIETAEIWVNELRVSGYDETNGWAAIANADVRLADVATVRGSIQRQTDGFGSLSSSLGEREQNALNNWSITSDFNAHKLVPERFGWTIPLSVQLQSNTSTPRFSPIRGDVRVQELVDQLNEREDLSDGQRKEEIRDVIESAQTHSSRRSFNARVGKQGSESWVLRNTIDALSVSYTYSDQAARSPSRRFDDNWQWSSSVNYRLTSRRPRTVKPLWFLDEFPLVGFLGDVQFAYLPQSLSLTGSARRSFGESRDRSRALRQEDDALPDIVRFPLRQQHSFSHDRGATIQYNPFRFLNLSYDAGTRQSLNALGVADTLYTEHEVPGVPTQTTQELLIRPFDSVVMRMASGDPLLRTESYSQRFTGTLRPNFSSAKALNFVTVQDVVYSARFSWQNGPLGNNRGAQVSNQTELRGGLTLRPQEFWRKFEFYRTLEEEQKAFEREKQAAQRQPARTQPAAADSSDVAEKEPRKPLVNPRAILRRTILAVTGMRDLNVTYTGTRSSSATNVGQDTGDGVDVQYSLWQALRGNGPSAAYRFGLDRTIPLEQRY